MLYYYRKNGRLPPPNDATSHAIPLDDDQDKYAFSSNPHDDLDAEEGFNDDVHRPPHSRNTSHGPNDDDEYELLHNNQPEELPASGARWGRDQPEELPASGARWGRDQDHLYEEQDTSYYGSGGIQNPSNNQGRHTLSYQPPKSPADSTYRIENPHDQLSPPIRHPSADPFADDQALGHQPGSYASRTGSGFPRGGLSPVNSIKKTKATQSSSPPSAQGGNPGILQSQPVPTPRRATRPHRPTRPPQARYLHLPTQLSY